MKKTKLLTSLAALALVLSLGACNEVTEEETGPTYKLGAYSFELESYEYFSGEASGNFLGVTSDWEQAADVTITPLDEGGSTLSFKDEEGATKYIVGSTASSTNVSLLDEDELGWYWVEDVEVFAYGSEEGRALVLYEDNPSLRGYAQTEDNLKNPHVYAYEEKPTTIPEKPLAVYENYTLTINFTGSRRIPDNATLYIIGSWDNWATFLPLEKGEDVTDEEEGTTYHVYSYTFASLTEGTYEYKGVAWYNDEEVSWAVSPDEIITAEDGGNATLVVGADDGEGQTVEVVTPSITLPTTAAAQDEILYAAANQCDDYRWPANNTAQALGWSAYHYQEYKTATGLADYYLTNDSDGLAYGSCVANAEELTTYQESNDGYIIYGAYGLETSYTYYYQGYEYSYYPEKELDQAYVCQETSATNFSAPLNGFTDLFNIWEDFQIYWDWATVVECYDGDVDITDVTTTKANGTFTLTATGEKTTYTYTTDRWYNFLSYSYTVVDDSGNVTTSQYAESVDASAVEATMTDFDPEDWGENANGIKVLLRQISNSDNYTLVVEYDETYSDTYSNDEQSPLDDYYADNLSVRHYVAKLTYTKDAILMEYFDSQEAYQAGTPYDVDAYVNDYDNPKYAAYGGDVYWAYHLNDAGELYTELSGGVGLWETKIPSALSLVGYESGFTEKSREDGVINYGLALDDYTFMSKLVESIFEGYNKVARNVVGGVTAMDNYIYRKEAEFYSGKATCNLNNGELQVLLSTAGVVWTKWTDTWMTDTLSWYEQDNMTATISNIGSSEIPTSWSQYWTD